MPDRISIAKIKDIPSGEARVYWVRGIEIAIFNVEGELYALDNLCPHQGGPLMAGKVHEKVVTCPWHHWQFHLETGASSVNPSISAKTYPVTIVDGIVKIEMNRDSLEKIL